MFKFPFIKQETRLIVIKSFFIFIFLLILGQLFNIQIIKSKGLILQAKKRLEQRYVLLRGDIRDRNGNLLALDVVTYDLYNNVRDLNRVNEDELERLAKILSITKEDLKSKLESRIDTRVISGLNQNIVNKINSERFNFIYLIPIVKRLYPHNHLAAQIIGFVNSDHKGQHGVEYFYEKLLTKVSDSEQIAFSFPKGNSIALSIDSVLQQYAEDELLSSIKRTKAEKGTILVLSPKTGEVYAWAVYPSFNPNLFFKEKAIKNWAITDIYEPGSTFKIITISSALENATIKKDTLFYDNGKIVVGKRTIKNHHKSKPENLNLLEVFKKSSNVASAQIGLTMSPKMFYDSIKKLMISEKTNIDLPGESKGLLLNYKDWKELDSATTAIGQGAVSVTPIQLASSIAAISNNGLWIQPHVLKGIWEPNYKLINESPRRIIQKQVISTETANYVSSLLTQSVKENLKAMAYIAGNVPGYNVAGKTGTAQKVRTDGMGYLPGHTIASFIGYFPAENPEILTLVIIDDPKTEGGWGNTVAGPLFNNVSAYAVKRILKK